MTNRRTITIIIACFVWVGGMLAAHSVSAHQPVVVNDATLVKIADPEISKAYYAELTGVSAHYRIKAEQGFAFYVNVLVPDIASATEDYSVTILRDGSIFAALSAGSEDWTIFHEPFGNDTYRQGPELRMVMPAGNYDLTVSNPNNEGKYVLAIGETEKFSLSEIPRTMSELVKVKRFFGKSAWAVLESPFAYWPTLGILFTIIVIILIVWWRKRRAKMAAEIR